MLWTAVGIWLEPLRSTFDYGQINVLLVLAVLYAVYSTRWWLSGLLVGLATSATLSAVKSLAMRKTASAIATRARIVPRSSASDRCVPTSMVDRRQSAPRR